MAVYEQDLDRIVIRVVYDGPGQSGKTTNIVQLARLFGGDSPDLQLVATDSGHTTHFDWFTFDGGMIDGHRLLIQIVGVPGAKRFEHRRAHILRSADAVVLVCDSDPSTADLARETLDSLREHLGKRAASVPVVVQANKQDAPGALQAHEVGAALGLPYEVPVIGAEATAGVGTRETAVHAIRSAVRLVKRRTAKPGLKSILGLAGTPSGLRAALETVRFGDLGPDDDDDFTDLLPEPPPTPGRKVARPTMVEAPHVVYMDTHSSAVQAAKIRLGEPGDADPSADPPDPNETLPSHPVLEDSPEPPPARVRTSRRRDPETTAGRTQRLRKDRPTQAIEARPAARGPSVQRKIPPRRPPASGPLPAASGIPTPLDRPPSGSVRIVKDRHPPVDVPRPTDRPPSGAVRVDDAPISVDRHPSGSISNLPDIPAAERSGAYRITPDAPPSTERSSTHRIDPQSPAERSGAHRIDPHSPAERSGAHRIDPQSPAERSGAHRIDPQSPAERSGAYRIDPTERSGAYRIDPQSPTERSGAHRIDPQSPAERSGAYRIDPQSPAERSGTHRIPSDIPLPGDRPPSGSVRITSERPPSGSVPIAGERTSSAPVPRFRPPTTPVTAPPLPPPTHLPPVTGPLPVRSTPDVPPLPAEPTHPPPPRHDEDLSLRPGSLSLRPDEPPTADLPPGHVWPVPNGRAVLKALAAAAPPRYLQGATDARARFSAGPFELTADAHPNQEAALAALLARAREWSPVVPLLPKGLALAVESEPDGTARLWRVAMQLPSLTDHLASLASAARLRLLETHADTLGQVFALARRKHVALDLHPAAYAVEYGRIVYVRDHFAQAGAFTDAAGLLALPEQFSEDPAIDAFLDALVRELAAVVDSRSDLGLVAALTHTTPHAPAAILARDRLLAALGRPP